MLFGLFGRTSGNLPSKKPAEAKPWHRLQPADPFVRAHVLTLRFNSARRRYDSFIQSAGNRLPCVRDGGSVFCHGSNDLQKIPEWLSDLLSRSYSVLAGDCLSSTRKVSGLTSSNERSPVSHDALDQTKNNESAGPVPDRKSTELRALCRKHSRIFCKSFSVMAATTYKRFRNGCLNC